MPDDLAPQSLDLAKLSDDLTRLLRLRNAPFGMKLFAEAAEMEAIPRIRRPANVHTLDQVVAQAARLGWTVGITSENLVGAQRRHEHEPVAFVDADRVRVASHREHLQRRGRDPAVAFDRVDADQMRAVRRTEQEATGPVERDVGEALGQR